MVLLYRKEIVISSEIQIFQKNIRIRITIL